MSAWTPIEEASSVFERPAWAIEKMVQEGRLQKRIEGDRVFVRTPPTIVELAAELAPFLPDEVVPVVATVCDVEEGDATPSRSLAEPSREEMMLRALFQLFEKQRAELAELRRAQAALPPPAVVPVKRRPSFLVGALVAFAALGVASFVATAIENERQRTEEILDHSEFLARELIRIAPVASATTLPAGWKR